ncbi:MAG: tetratricopeptide repeat protein [Prevotellaceae bacterium]|jgi:tetratricopeptide (TPR) repeat protein|nr:tetratricopeptide repeat protein [Prevotellaceae bacterium]
MKKRNFLSKREKEQQLLSEQYEKSVSGHKPVYMDSDDISMLADWHFVHKEYAKAFEMVDYGLRLHPDSEELITRKAYLYLDAGYERQIPELLEKLPGDSDDIHLLRARVAGNKEDYDKVWSELNEIHETDDLITAVEAAYLCLEIDEPDKAMEWLTPIKDEYDDEEPFMAAMADVSYVLRETKQAAKYYNRLLDVDPYVPNYWYGLSRCYFVENNYEQAIDACNYALIGDDGYGEAYLMRANAYRALGNSEAALTDYIQANKCGAFPTESVYAFKASIAMDKHGWSEGLENLTMAIRESESFDGDRRLLAILYVQSSLCYLRLHNYHQVHLYCQKAKRVNPENGDAYLIEGRAYLEEKKEMSAMQAWANALLVEPGIGTWFEIGTHLFEMGNITSACNIYEDKVAAENVEYKNVKEYLAVIHLLLGNAKKFAYYNNMCDNPITDEDVKDINALIESGKMGNVIEATKILLLYLKRD